MNSYRCPQCGVPAEAGTFLPGMIHCDNCDYSGKPMAKEIAPKAEEEQNDSFNEELGAKSISSKLAMLSLCIFFISITIPNVINLAVASMGGFVMFSVFHLFLKLMNR